MLLLFLVIFAVLTMAIVRQIERGQAEPPYPEYNCPGCAGPVELDWLICPRCKELLQTSCSTCGQRIPEFHNYCTACGAARQQTFGELTDDCPV